MDNYLDPDEEYELQYQQELELIQQQEEEYGLPDETIILSKKSKQRIDFGKKTSILDDFSRSFNHAVNQTENILECHSVTTAAVKRTSSEIISLNDNPPSKRSKHNNFITTPSDLDLGVSLIYAPETNSNKVESINCNLFGVTSLRLPKWNFLTLNTDFGERLYVRLRPQPVVAHDSLDVITKGRVSDSFRRLKESVLQKLNEPKLEAPMVVDENELQESSDLWVEQFKPKRYIELLSDEGVNRALLTWVKCWDKVVFNRERRLKIVASKDTTKFVPFKNKSQLIEEKANELDEDGRPHFKVALLCGSPGIGKTTLAHVIASLAGYNVIEVNASDDRNVETFRSKLTSATEMQSVLGSKKPNCLILDEIDGAPAVSIDFLIKFVSGKVADKTKKGKKEKTQKIVKRPVICICNEPYTPTLRQLRQNAYVLHFPNTSSTKLAQRLLEICSMQGMKTDLSTLCLLCEKSRSDIRSCITTLHFFKTQKRAVFKSNDVKNANIGVKDMQKSQFSVWQEIFQKPIQKSMHSEPTAAGGGESSENSRNLKRLENILQLLSSSGDYEKLQQGVYENMLKVRLPWYERAISSGLEWFYFSDILETSIRHGQNFALLPYMPYCFAAWHFLFSSPTWPKLTYPSSGYENFVKESKCKQIVTDVMRGLKPSLRAFYQRKAMLLDVLPLLPTLLTPPLRPVNTKLFNDREKADLHNVVSILIDFNMNYVQQRALDGSYFYQIDPDYEEVVHFPSLTPRGSSHPYSLKQIISREVEMERVRRSDFSHSSGAEKSAVTASTPSHEAKLVPKSVPDAPMQYKDFFGRVIQIKPEETDSSERNNLLKNRITYRYKQGYNNAVKKKVTIADFL